MQDRLVLDRMSGEVSYVPQSLEEQELRRYTRTQLIAAGWTQLGFPGRWTRPGYDECVETEGATLAYYGNRSHLQNLKAAGKSETSVDAFLYEVHRGTMRPEAVTEWTAMRRKHPDATQEEILLMIALGENMHDELEFPPLDPEPEVPTPTIYSKHA